MLEHKCSSFHLSVLCIICLPLRRLFLFFSPFHHGCFLTRSLRLHWTLLRMWKKMPWKPKESEKGKEKSKEIPPLLHRVAKSQETHGKGLLLRLVFISDHGEPLDICLNRAQADRPVACYLYDYLMNLNQ
eukprot:EG_transcript_44702